MIPTTVEQNASMAIIPIRVGLKLSIIAANIPVYSYSGLFDNVLLTEQRLVMNCL